MPDKRSLKINRKMLRVLAKSKSVNFVIRVILPYTRSRNWVENTLYDYAAHRCAMKSCHERKIRTRGKCKVNEKMIECEELWMQASRTWQMGERKKGQTERERKWDSEENETSSTGKKRYHRKTCRNPCWFSFFSFALCLYTLCARARAWMYVCACAWVCVCVWL